MSPPGSVTIAPDPTAVFTLSDPAAAPARSGRRRSAVTGHCWVLMVNSTAPRARRAGPASGARCAARPRRRRRHQGRTTPATRGARAGTGRRGRGSTGSGARPGGRPAAAEERVDLGLELLGVVRDRGVDGRQRPPELLVQAPVRGEAQRGRLEAVAAARVDHQAEVLLHQPAGRVEGVRRRRPGPGRVDQGSARAPAPDAVGAASQASDQLEHLRRLASRCRRAGRRRPRRGARCAAGALRASSASTRSSTTSQRVQVEGADAHRQPRGPGVSASSSSHGGRRRGEGVHRAEYGSCRGARRRGAPRGRGLDPAWKSRQAPAMLSLSCAGPMSVRFATTARTSNRRLRRPLPSVVEPRSTTEQALRRVFPCGASA